MEWGTEFAPNDWASFSRIVQAVVEGGADAIITTFGCAMRFHDELLGTPMILTLNHGLSDRSYSSGFVREASRLGADAVKVHFFGPVADTPVLELQKLSTECRDHGMPFLFEPIPMSDYPKAGGQQLRDPESVKKAVDSAVILGADIIKTSYTGNAKSFSEVTHGCPVPIIIAGGTPQPSDRPTLEMIEGALEGGASGGAIGRNITMHRDPMKITRAISAIIHDDRTVGEALRLLA